jgi:hypothetical protein
MNDTLIKAPVTATHIVYHVLRTVIVLWTLWCFFSLARVLYSLYFTVEITPEFRASFLGTYLLIKLAWWLGPTVGLGIIALLFRPK